MTYVQALTGGGGWPMSVFLTPDLQPIYGATYLPPRDAPGLPAFTTVLRRIADVWASERRGDLVAQAADTLEQLRAFAESGDGGDGGGDGAPPPKAVLAAAPAAAARELLRRFDAARGGFGGAPKFPRPAELAALLAAAAQALLSSGGGGEGSAAAEAAAAARQLLRAALRTLRGYCEGGMYDHIGGGFHRYSVDELLHVPHVSRGGWWWWRWCWWWWAVGGEGRGDDEHHIRIITLPLTSTTITIITSHHHHIIAITIIIQQFEKMLYDNPQLVSACLDALCADAAARALPTASTSAAGATGSTAGSTSASASASGGSASGGLLGASKEPAAAEWAAAAARGTLDYMLRDLAHPEGGFFSAEDADSADAAAGGAKREGAFYVWTRGEVEAALSEAGVDPQLFCEVYDVRPGGARRRLALWLAFWPAGCACLLWE